MPSLSFKAGKPETCEAVALVRGGKQNKRILQVHHDMEANGRFTGKEEGEKEIILSPESMFKPIPNPDPNKREIQQICGASGSGKSFMAKMLAENQRKLFPERPVQLVSKLMEDETLDSMEGGAPKRVKTETLVDNPITDLKELNGGEGCLLLVDDVDTFEKGTLEAVQQLIDDVAALGRHTKTSMCVMTHRLTNQSKTRLLLNETTHFVVYPQSTSQHHLRQLLTNQAGLTPEQVKDLRRMGRWVLIAKQFPSQVLSIQEARSLVDWDEKPNRGDYARKN